MKYYISYIIDTTCHGLCYPLVGGRAYTVDTSIEYTEDGDEIVVKKRNSNKSVALIACHDDYTAVEGQTLYGIDELQKCINEHPELDYSLLGQAWINGELIPNKDFIS